MTVESQLRWEGFSANRPEVSLASRYVQSPMFVVGWADGAVVVVTARHCLGQNGRPPSRVLSPKPRAGSVMRQFKHVAVFALNYNIIELLKMNGRRRKSKIAE
jgi:hypothetical protein